MNVISCITKMKPQTISKVNALCTMAEESETMKDLFDRVEKMNAEARYSVWNALAKENKLIE